MTHEELFQFLNNHNISHKTTKHHPVYTVEESKDLHKNIPGAHTKTLFLRPKKKENYILVPMIGEDRLDIKGLSKNLSQGNLSLASKERLWSVLGLEPGHVTPFGLCNITNQQNPHPELKIIVDQELFNHTQVNFHPLRNDMTTTISVEDFRVFLSLFSQFPHQIENLPKLS